MRIIVLLLSLLIASSNLTAEDDDNQRRVGYIDLEYVFENSALKEKLYREYQNQRENIIEAKTNAEKNLHMLKHELRQKEMMLGAAEYKAELDGMKDRIKEYEEQIIEARKELRKWEADLLATVFDDIITVFEVIAAEKNLDVILSKKTSVLYGQNDLDFSQDAIDLINDIDERNTPSAK